MVDLKKALYNDEKSCIQVSCRIPLRYSKKLKESGVGFTAFTLQALKETFDNKKSREKKNHD